MKVNIYMGKKNGKGKKYYKDGQLMYEGEYFYDKEWNGIGYDINGNKAYKLINGKGKIKVKMIKIIQN